MTDYLNREGHIWTPTKENSLGFCITPSPNPASQPGFARLRMHASHIIERDATGVPHCARCGRNLDAEYKAIEKREIDRNIKEV